MTFEEAVVVKGTLPSEITYAETLMTLYVVPLEPHDYGEYLEFYYTNTVDDNTAKLFCKDGNYTINALTRMGTWRLYLDLPDIRKVCNRS